MSPDEFRDKIIPVGRKLYTFAFRFLNSREESEDVAQEVMMRLWERREELIKYNSTEALAMTITRNICLDRLRHRKHETYEEECESALMISGDEPSEKIENTEASEMIRMIISKLKEPYKSAIILRDIEGLTYEESSGITGLTINALRVNLSRARKMVRNEMTKIYSYGSERYTGNSRQVLRGGNN
jgi:RNA polymerase sigma factor (sigma-70 family)